MDKNKALRDSASGPEKGKLTKLIKRQEKEVGELLRKAGVESNL